MEQQNEGSRGRLRWWIGMGDPEAVIAACAHFAGFDEERAHERARAVAAGVVSAVWLNVTISGEGFRVTIRDGAPGRSTLECSIPSEHAVSAAHRVVRECARLAGFELERARELDVVASEALTNAYRFTRAQRSGVVALHLTMVAKRLDIIVKQPDEWRLRPPPPDLEAESGRGLPLMVELADEFSIKDGGRVVRASAYL